MKIEGDKVIDQYGAVLAEYVHGEWHSKDPAVLEFINSQNTKPKTETKKVRARNEDGTLKGDDPSTPDVNEAWTTKVVKKATGKS
jgi:hypothetical protein|tara:strand:- start:986 stop:1240 length:255 start_codon:yes stop_codon:yes gene_type:complete